jgi:hypothetical protein
MAKVKEVKAVWSYFDEKKGKYMVAVGNINNIQYLERDEARSVVQKHKTMKYDVFNTPKELSE